GVAIDILLAIDRRVGIAAARRNDLNGVAIDYRVARRSSVKDLQRVAPAHPRPAGGAAKADRLDGAGFQHGPGRDVRVVKDDLAAALDVDRAAIGRRTVGDGAALDAQRTPVVDLRVAGGAAAEDFQRDPVEDLHPAGDAAG